MLESAFTNLIADPLLIDAYIQFERRFLVGSRVVRPKALSDDKPDLVGKNPIQNMLSRSAAHELFRMMRCAR